MEPRPPRPRQQYLPAADAGAARPRGGPGEGMYAPPPGGYGAPAYPPELDLLPRQQRHRQRIARNVLLVLLVVAALGALGWFVRDRFFTGPPASQTAQIVATLPPSLPAVDAGGSPAAAAATEPTTDASASHGGLLATSTPIPPSAPATDATGDSPAGETAPTPAPAVRDEEPPPPAAPIDLEALLPTEAQLPVTGLPMTNSGDRPLSAVLATFGSEEAQAEADTQLTAWGWRANVFRDFSVDPTLISPSDTSALTVSIHQFADEPAAGEALLYFSNVLIAAGSEEVMADAIGDETRLLREVTEDGTTNVAAYVVDGPLLYRIGGSSPAGDPTESVLLLANTLVAGE